MTKFETRVLIMGLLEIEDGDRLIDIGAGTGSISLEASMQGADVCAVEREAEGTELIRANAEKFGAEIDVVEGLAPEVLEGLGKFDKVFVGGSGKQISGIVKWASENIERDGIIAGSFITLSNLVEFKETLKEYGFIEVETRMISTAKAEGKAELMKAQNPIFIVRGRSV